MFVDFSTDNLFCNFICRYKADYPLHCGSQRGPKQTSGEWLCEGQSSLVTQSDCGRTYLPETQRMACIINVKGQSSLISCAKIHYKSILQISPIRILIRSTGTYISSSKFLLSKFLTQFKIILTLGSCMTLNFKQNYTQLTKQWEICLELESCKFKNLYFIFFFFVKTIINWKFEFISNRFISFFFLSLPLAKVMFPFRLKNK